MAKTTIPVKTETRKRLKLKQYKIFAETDKQKTYDDLIQEALDAQEELEKIKKQDEEK